MHFAVLNSKAVSREICEEHQPPLVNFMPTTRQWEIKNQRFGRQYTVFPDFLSSQNMVRSRVKLYGNDLRGNKNYFKLARGSSYRG